MTIFRGAFTPKFVLMGKMVSLRDHFSRIQKTKALYAISRGDIDVLIDEDLLAQFNRESPEGCLSFREAARKYGLSVGLIRAYKKRGVLKGPDDADYVFDGQPHPQTGKPYRGAIPDGCLSHQQAAELYGISVSQIIYYKSKGLLSGPVNVAAVYEGQPNPVHEASRRKGLDMSGFADSESALTRRRNLKWIKS